MPFCSVQRKRSVNFLATTVHRVVSCHISAGCQIRKNAHEASFATKLSVSAAVHYFSFCGGANSSSVEVQIALLCGAANSSV